MHLYKARKHNTGERVYYKLTRYTSSAVDVFTMEVLGVCYTDGVPLEICKFSINNDSEESLCEDHFQRQMVDRWRAIFKSSERDDPILLSVSRDCHVHASSVGALWRQCAFVLLPKKPLPRGPTSHQQRLLAVTVGAAERLTAEELAGRVRATYGSTALLHNQRLQRHGGGGRDGAGSVGEYSYPVRLLMQSPFRCYDPKQ